MSITNCWKSQEENLITILSLQTTFVSWTGEALPVLAAEHIFRYKFNPQESDLDTWAIVASARANPHIRELGPSGNYLKAGTLTLRLCQRNTTPVAEEDAIEAMVDTSGDLLDELLSYIIQNGQIPIREGIVESIHVVGEKYKKAQTQIVRCDYRFNWKEW